MSTRKPSKPNPSHAAPYEPTIREIELAKEAIQAEWTNAERLSRMGIRRTSRVESLNSPESRYRIAGIEVDE